VLLGRGGGQSKERKEIIAGDEKQRLKNHIRKLKEEGKI